MVHCLIYLIIMNFLSACSPDDSKSTKNQDQSINVEFDIPVKESTPSSEDSGILEESTNMEIQQFFPPISNVVDSEALFHWRPILNENPEELGISLSGSAFIDDEGLNLTGNDAFASYTLSTTSMVDEIKNANEFFIRLWVKSAKDQQEGPARIFTWSSGTDNRNLTVGQGNYDTPSSKLTLRLRLNLGEDISFLQGKYLGSNIIESEDNVLTKSNGWQRVEVQYQEGFVCLWIDDQIIIRDMTPYDLSAWDNTMSFGFGQEFNLVEMPTGSLRAWSGHIGEIVFYAKAQKAFNLE